MRARNGSIGFKAVRHDNNNLRVENLTRFEFYHHDSPAGQ